MARSLVLLALLGARIVLAEYEHFFYTTEATKWKCPRYPFKCAAPSVCAYNRLLDKYYCCSADADGVCHAGSTKCSGENKTPGTGQIGCSSGVNAYCCQSGNENWEECTQRTKQVNVCWAVPKNPMDGVGKERSNVTYSSLSSANPSATAFTIDPQAFFSTSTSTPSTSTEPSTSSTPPSSTNGSASPDTQTSAIPGTNDPTSIPPNPEQSSSSGLSGGAIGGIVVGALAGLALIGAGIFIFLRRRKRQNPGTELDGNPYNHNGFAYVGHNIPQEKPAQIAAHEADASQSIPPVEMDGSERIRTEMEGNKPANNSQLIR